MSAISVVDAVALSWFAFCWLGYAYLCDQSPRGGQALMRKVHVHREQWMRETVRRDNRIVDSALVNNLMRGVSFFASTTILILGGLLTVLGYGERAIEITADLPLARQTTRELWEFKLFLLIAIFFYGFFKFTWSLRQYIVLSILIGGAPPPGGPRNPEEEFVRSSSRISSYAGDEFIRGVRAYYFGIAAVTWFIQPWVFMAVTSLVVAVLYWRDFHSPTLLAIAGDTPGPARQDIQN